MLSQRLLACKGIILALAVLGAPSAQAAAAAEVKAPRLVTMTAKTSSSGGRCQALAYFPALRELPSPTLQAKLNRYLEQFFLGKNHEALQGGRPPCSSTYLSSISFAAALSGSGVLSVERIRRVARGDLPTDTVEKECVLIDVRRGGRVEIASWLGEQDLKRLSELVNQSLKERFGERDLQEVGFAVSPLSLARGNFSACFFGPDLVVIPGPSLLTPTSRLSVELRIPLASLGREAP